ncbi:MAG TPA: GMC family oxidoreductase [Pseudogracilibacillus sp.]|nr:GMC family oxidoreductase [Pseudogracilibacillus sp.]
MTEKLPETDVVIIGSGWAGGIAAAELTKAGYQVICLERGPDRKREDFIASKDELRYLARHELYKDLSDDTYTIRNNSDEEAIPLRRHQTDMLHDEGTGGTGVHWAGQTDRYLPFDFTIGDTLIEKYGKANIPSNMTVQNWGITYEELEPYYHIFEQTVGVAGKQSPLGAARSSDYPNPPMKEMPMMRLFREAAENLGYHPYPIPAATMSQAYTNPDGEKMNACEYCGFCSGYGCGYGAKADPLNTVLSTAKKSGRFELKNHAYVARILYEGNKAIGVRYIDTQTGKKYEQPAALIVSAAFTFGNTRLLLLSGIGEPYHPETKTGVIGKNMTAHYNNLSIKAGSVGFFNEKKFNSYAGAGGLGTVIDDFNPENFNNENADFLHGFQLSISQTGAGAIGNNQVPSNIPSWGKDFKDASLYYTHRNLTVGTLNSCLPRDHNYMDLDPVYKDSFGDPLLRLTVQYTDQERNMLRFTNEKSQELLQEMGADIIDSAENPEDIEFTPYSVHNHTVGGVMMGESPYTSAVNNYSQMWEMDNLFILGGSSFPHSSCYNPTGTIGALAYRATERMIQYLQSNEG